MSTNVQVVKLSDIRENPVALRAVDRESEAFLGLRDSIRESGLLNAISLREKSIVVDGVEIKFFELIDGLHRYSAAKDAGLDEIPAILLDLSDTEVLEAQVMANVHKIETRAVEYTKALNRILASNPTMTVSELAGRLSKSGSWLSQRLGLLKLTDAIAQLVDEGKIKVSNAVALSKLPQDEQVGFVDSAMTMGADEFVPTVQARQKELRDAAKAGRKAEPVTFAPVMRLQKMSILRDEYETPSVGPEIVKANRVKTPEGGFALGVAWALNIDPMSAEIQRAKAEAKQKALEDEKKKRAAARATKKAEEAQEAAAKAAAAISG